MAVYLISTAVLIIIGYLLYTPLRLRLWLAETEKYVRFSYSIFGVVLDIGSMKLQFFVGRIRVYTFDVKKAGLKKIDEIAKKKRKGRKTEKSKPGKRKRFELPGFWFEYLKGAWNIVGHIRLDHLDIKISGGIFDPFYTGKFFGYYWAARGAFPRLMSHVQFRPDFSSETLQVEGKGVVYLRLYFILKVVLGLLAVMIKEKLTNLFTIRKRGPSYG